MNYVKVKAFAKINLTLDVLGVSGGYHMIDSVVASIDIYDLIAVKKRRDSRISITMRGMGCEDIPPERNNAYRAAVEFCKAFNTCGADVTVYKNIPVGAGLGGSSADVAGVLNALSIIYEVEDGAAIKQIADGIGSDCGYMLSGGYARISGRGEKVKPINSDIRLDIGILLPQAGVSTAECYALAGDRGKEFFSDGAERALIDGDVRAIGGSLSNGLYGAASRLCKDVEECYNYLQSFYPCGVNMTGSGSAVYALFENDQFLKYAHSRNNGKCKFIMTKTVTPKGDKKWQRKD